MVATIAFRHLVYLKMASSATHSIQRSPSYVPKHNEMMQVCIDVLKLQFSLECRIQLDAPSDIIHHQPPCVLNVSIISK